MPNVLLPSVDHMADRRNSVRKHLMRNIKSGMGAQEAWEVYGVF